MNYDKEKYKIWDWKSLVIFNWIINPVLVINELLLGQTIPKVILIEREGAKPFYQRSLIPCPHCGELHSGLKYSAQNKTSFKNWFGLYCDSCKGIIPVQRNLFSLIILAVTYPIWGWFKVSLKQKWLDKQPERFRNINLEFPEKRNTTKRWLISGFFFGLFMFIGMVIINPTVKGDGITLKAVLIGIPLWLIGGLAWGLTMNGWMNKKGKENKAHNNV